MQSPLCALSAAVTSSASAGFVAGVGCRPLTVTWTASYRPGSTRTATSPSSHADTRSVTRRRTSSRDRSVLLRVESGAQAVQRGGEALVPEAEVLPPLGDVLRGLLDRHAFLTDQPAAQHQAGPRGAAVAVDQHPPALVTEGGQVVEDVGQHVVQTAVVVVVRDISHAVHLVAERLAEPAQRDDGEVRIAVPGAVEVARPDARQDLGRSDLRDDSRVIGRVLLTVERGRQLLEVGEPPQRV